MLKVNEYHNSYNLTGDYNKSFDICRRARQIRINTVDDVINKN